MAGEPARRPQRGKKPEDEGKATNVKPALLPVDGSGISGAGGRGRGRDRERGRGGAVQSKAVPALGARLPASIPKKKKFAPLDIDALLAEKNEKRRAAAEAASAAAAATAASDMAERAGSQALPSARRGPGAGSRVEVLTEAVEEGPASIRSGSAAAARGVKSEMDEAEDLLRRMDGLDEASGRIDKELGGLGSGSLNLRTVPGLYSLPLEEVFHVDEDLASLARRTAASTLGSPAPLNQRKGGQLCVPSSGNTLEGPVALGGSLAGGPSVQELLSTGFLLPLLATEKPNVTDLVPGPAIQALWRMATDGSLHPEEGEAMHASAGAACDALCKIIEMQREGTQGAASKAWGDHCGIGYSAFKEVLRKCGYCPALLEQDAAVAGLTCASSGARQSSTEAGPKEGNPRRKGAPAHGGGGKRRRAAEAASDRVAEAIGGPEEPDTEGTDCSCRHCFPEAPVPLGHSGCLAQDLREYALSDRDTGGAECGTPKGHPGTDQMLPTGDEGMHGKNGDSTEPGSLAARGLFPVAQALGAVSNSLKILLCLDYSWPSSGSALAPWLSRAERAALTLHLMRLLLVPEAQAPPFSCTLRNALSWLLSSMPPAPSTPPRSSLGSKVKATSGSGRGRGKRALSSPGQQASPSSGSRDEAGVPGEIPLLLCNANWAPGIPFSEPAEKPALDPRKMLLPCLQLLLQFPCGSSGDPWLPADQGVAPGATGTSHAVHAVSSIDRLVLDSAMLLMCAALLPDQGRTGESLQLLLEWSKGIPAPVGQNHSPVISLHSPDDGDESDDGSASGRVARAWAFLRASKGRKWLLLQCLVRFLGGGALGSLELGRDEASGGGRGSLGSSFCVMLLLDIAFSLLLQGAMDTSSCDSNGVPGSGSDDADDPEAMGGFAEEHRRSITLSLFSDWLQKASRLPTSDPRPDAPLLRLWAAFLYQRYRFLASM